MVAELGAVAETDQIYRLTYDGSVADENGYAVMGGSAEAITETVRSGYAQGLDLTAAIQLAVRALATDGGPNATPRELGAAALEVAILDRTRVLPRKFRRIKGSWLTGLLTDGPGPSEPAPPDPGPEPPPALPPVEVPETDLGQNDG